MPKSYKPLILQRDKRGSKRAGDSREANRVIREPGGSQRLLSEGGLLGYSESFYRSGIFALEIEYKQHIIPLREYFSIF